jgi:hypothetical protein
MANSKPLLKIDRTRYEMDSKAEINKIDAFFNASHNYITRKNTYTFSFDMTAAL